MTDSSTTTVRTTDQARGAEMTGVMRYVLAVSVGLAVLAMVLIGMFFI